MKIRINASKEYDVIIERGGLKKTGEYLKALSLGGKACVIGDTNVMPLYKEIVKGSLSAAGFKVYEYTFAAGEKSKNADTYLSILGFLAENNFTRNDTLLALGGGVTGDLTGFAAASYMRGINLVQLPTSLLAAVDSSVGGKTAIDMPQGKNLVGAFYQPRMVVFDTDTLKTLPKEYFADGCGEVVKYAMIAKDSIEEMLLNTDENIESIVSECVKIKGDIVNADEFEGGRRRILNFGHTVGHAIEKASEFNISHGRAVAMGMRIITRAREKRGLCKEGTLRRLEKMLSGLGLNDRCDFSADVLFKNCVNDKKAEGESINLVVPLEVGRCEVKKVAMTELYDILKLGLEIL